MTLAAPQPGQCVVCRFAEEGVAFAPPGKRRLKPHEFTWVCEADIPYAKTVHHMPKDTFNRIEREAVDAAGRKAGAYLDSIGQTDLATLTAVQWGAFLDTFLTAFGEEMRDRLGAHQAPF